MVLLLALLLASLLGGCFLLPKEAAVPALPLVTPYSGAEYRTAQVLRGDLTLTREVSCAYSATRREDLKFAVADKPFGAMLVSAGDVVSAGDMVATLDAAQAEQRLSQADGSVARLEVQVAAAETALALAKEREALEGGGSTISSEARAADLTYLQASLEIQKQKQAELRAELESLRLYAGIGGTVTYVKRLTEGAKSSKAEVVVTVTDTASSVFSASTDLYDAFPPGKAVTVSADGVDYPCVAVSAASLGLEEKADQSTDSRMVYLSITGPEAPTGGSARGAVTLTLDSREDVLYVPRQAVFTVGDRSYVYYQEESGLKSARQVVCGLTAGRSVEIVEGLGEGDTVILG